MKSGIRWQVRGVQRQARETAREAARRSGMSVGQWLDTVIRDTAAESADPAAEQSSQQASDRMGPESNAPHAMLDDIEPRFFEHDEDLDPMRRLPGAEAYPDDVTAGHTMPKQGHTGDEARRPTAGRADRPQPSYRQSASFESFGGSPLDSLTQKLAEDEARAKAQPRPDAPSRHSDGLASVNHRLDSLSRQLESIAQRNAGAAHAPQSTGGPGETTRQLTEVIANIGRRLDQLATGSRPPQSEPEEHPVPAADLAAGSPDPNPPAEPVTIPLEQALKEIADRQKALDDDASTAATPASVGEQPPHQPAQSTALPRAYTQELSGLEQQLRQINEQIGVLNRPCGIDKAIELLRDDLAEIGVMLQDAMPRKAVEALESEMRKLADRIEETRQTASDGTALAGIEHGLIEVRDALHALKPAENLTGLDDELKVLAQRIDDVAGQSQDPASLKQLEGAIVAMRGIVTQVASNDALADLAAEVRTLSARVDQIAAVSGSSDMFAALEQRIGTLADALEARNRKSEEPSESDSVVAGLVDKMERLQATSVDQTALRHLEDRIAMLVEKLDASDSRLNQLEAVERGLAELLIHLEHQRVPNLMRSGGEPPPEVDALVRDVTNLKEMERQTQDALEAVHGTLGHVVDRLAMIETDMRDTAAMAADLAPVPPAAAAPPAQSPSVAALKPAMPDQQAPSPPPAAALKMSALTPSARPESAAAQAPAAPVTPPPAAALNPEAPHQPQPKPASPAVAARQPIDPNLPPDHPLEPGVSRGRQPASQPASPADRIAASEAVLGIAKPPVIPDPVGKSNFIAAARRAAQAAASEAPQRSGNRKPEAATRTSSPGTWTGLLRKHARAMIIGVSVLAIVLGSLNIVLNWLSSEEPVKSATGSNGSDKTATSESQRGEVAPKPPAAAPASVPDTATEPPATPATPAPPPGRQSSLPSPSESVAANSLLSVASVGTLPRPAAPDAVAPTVEAAPAPVPTPAPAPATPTRATPIASANSTEKLPPGIGGALRAAAVKGDPAAQYEIAQRYADGRGVTQDLAESAAWLERAAKQGLAPAQFRLGGLYEKGVGVKKNLDNARHLYAVAGEAGNAKALHNLAVLYAEGIDGKPDYQSAAQWFRKAAAYGMADSQYNLGVLYARGIGVEQNLAEAYRWFALAAREGDQESEKKRAELAQRLDAKSLENAQQVIDGFTPEQQPDAAIHVKAPAGGWDATASKAVAAPPPGKRKPAAKTTAPRADGTKLDLSTPQPRH